MQVSSHSFLDERWVWAIVNTCVQAFVVDTHVQCSFPLGKYLPVKQLCHGEFTCSILSYQLVFLIDKLDLTTM